MKAYKIFNPDFTCKGYQYKVGERYKYKQRPILYERGFHACIKPSKLFSYYTFNPNNIVCEVEIHGKWVGNESDKICTNDIEIIRQLTWEEVLKICNDGKDNVGYSNTGGSNTGDWNTGYFNTNEPKVRIFKG